MGALEDLHRRLLCRLSSSSSVCRHVKIVEAVRGVVCGCRPSVCHRRAVSRCRPCVDRRFCCHPPCACELWSLWTLISGNSTLSTSHLHYHWTVQLIISQLHPSLLLRALSFLSPCRSLSIFIYLYFFFHIGFFFFLHKIWGRATVSPTTVVL